MELDCPDLIISMLNARLKPFLEKWTRDELKQRYMGLSNSVLMTSHVKEDRLLFDSLVNCFFSVTFFNTL